MKNGKILLKEIKKRKRGRPSKGKASHQEVHRREVQGPTPEDMKKKAQDRHLSEQDELDVIGALFPDLL